MGVYNRLGGKEGLVDALLIKGFDRLRAAVDARLDPAPGADMRARFYDCGLRYREFALANPHFYAIMFEDAIPHEFDNPRGGGARRGGLRRAGPHRRALPPRPA